MKEKEGKQKNLAKYANYVFNDKGGVMPITFSDELIEEIRLRADIVDVVSEYVSLEKKGQNYEGLCPFHHEKTPSFKVNREKQICHCFGCGAGGDIFSFIMSRENINFAEALEKLAHKYGVELPKQQLSMEQQEQLKKVDRIIAANELANKYFNYLLNQSQGHVAKKYLARRGITEEEIAKFHLGYSLDGWEGFSKLAQSRGFSEKELIEAGLVVKRERGTGVYDRFRNRLMFAIFNPRGQPIGFGGRVLDDNLPKYLNTGETTVFNKRNNLYGLHWASASIRQQGYVIIMEGYMDVIAAVQFGVENVVASLGTAFAIEQARLLKRYTENVIICYDSDAAGQKASLRGMDILRDEKCQVQVMSLPKGQDPDDFIRKEGKEAFLEMALKEAKSLIEYKLDLLLTTQNKGTSEWKAEIFNKIKPDLQKIENAIKRDEYIKIVSTKLEIDDNAIREELVKRNSGLQKNGIIRDKKTKIRNTSNRLDSLSITKPASALEQAERQLFFLMVEDKAVREHVFKELGNNFFTNSLFSQLINKAKSKWDAGLEVSPAWILSDCDTENDQSIVEKAFNMSTQGQKVRDKLVQDCIYVILQRQKQEKLVLLKKQLKEAELTNDFITVKKLLAEIQQFTIR